MYFSKSNKMLEDKIDRYFAYIGAEAEKRYPGMISVMLLGSMSRGEATWAINGEEPYLLSDIEFFTVYSDEFGDFAGFDAILAGAAKTVFGTEQSSLFHIDNTYISRSGMPHMEKKLLTFDAQVYGRCVVGKDVKNLLPNVTLENINLRDIKDIMSHRVFSVVYYGFPLKEAGNTEEYRYCLAKNSLDLMTVLLIQRGKLVSGFGNRLRVLNESDISDEYKKYFEYCLSVKNNSIEAELFSIDEMERIFLEISMHLYKTFRMPLKNRWLNKKRLARRGMGIVKRAIKTKHIVKLPFFMTLYKYAEKRKKADKKLCMDNYVINGYPAVK